jgi:hypothetical protein
VDSSNSDTRNSNDRSGFPRAVLLIFIAAILVSGRVSYGDEQKAKVTVKEITITKTVDTSSPTLFLSVTVATGVHVVSEVLIRDGVATNFSLEANLEHGSALTLDGTQRFRAVGASYQSYAPVSPTDPRDQTLDWTFIFSLVPNSPGSIPVPHPNIGFNLTLRTTYNADGSLADVTLSDED